jgi:long-subunit acyl-CoA synthetase (AMP-forming)
MGETMNLVDFLFEKSRNCDNDIVLGNSETISYREIYKQIIAIANYLIKEIGENYNILLISDNSTFFIASYFGIIKSGNTCIPINPGTSITTLSHIIALSETKICFIQGRYESKLKKSKTININENISEEIFKEYTNDKVRSQNIDQRRIAEILFTSGSTSLPKGVM